MKGEFAEIEPQPPTLGAAEAVERDEEHSSHTFLYIPDLSAETGWVSHRVPERRPERRTERVVGFRR